MWSILLQTLLIFSLNTTPPAGIFLLMSSLTVKMRFQQFRNAIIPKYFFIHNIEITVGIALHDYIIKKDCMQ